MSVRSVAFAALVAAIEVVAQDVVVDVPNDLSPRPLVSDVYGYSIEPIWVNDYVSTPLAANLLSAIADVTGKPPGIRVGGNTADQTYIHDTLPTGNDSVAIPDLASAKLFNITPSWYDGWAGYFPANTDFIYTLNLAVNDSAWANAVAEAAAAHAALGDKLALFELGNEIDHFIHKGWRDPSWAVATYLQQFRNLSGQVVGSAWYKALPPTRQPKFQAGVFADPPWVPDQQDEVDDFSIQNLTLAETAADREVVGTYATHLYPQSTCDAPRWLRMRLDLLSNHTALWLNVSQYAPQAAAAEAAGAPLVMGETNSVSCGGKSGISDTFGAALWGADYVLTGASIGVRKTYFHLGAQSEYSAFTPRGYEWKNESLGAGIRANWYGHYFVAKVVATALADEALSVAALPGANSSDLSGFAVYSSAAAGNGSAKALKKLVFLDMGVWNGTEGLSNNSTLSATDGAFFSQGARPNATVRVATPWAAGTTVGVTRLTGPGTNAKSGVAVSGVTFDPETGAKVGWEVEETLQVGQDGAVVVSLRRAEGVLLEVVGASNGTSGAGSGGPTSPEISGASEKGAVAWGALLMGVVSAVFVMGF
ncbi:glycoside hydrolase superfamily [Annulohypoxylon bovei var. microspora]|nr:glycoside hydrolase superfamily [Annulohypoxylon bovei var. microspora]